MAILEKTTSILSPGLFTINYSAAMLDQLGRLGFKAYIRNILYGNTHYLLQLNIKAFPLIHDFIQRIERFYETNSNSVKLVLHIV